MSPLKIFRNMGEYASPGILGCILGSDKEVENVIFLGYGIEGFSVKDDNVMETVTWIVFENQGVRWHTQLPWMARELLGIAERFGRKGRIGLAQLGCLHGLRVILYPQGYVVNQIEYVDN